MIEYLAKNAEPIIILGSSFFGAITIYSYLWKKGWMGEKTSRRKIANRKEIEKLYNEYHFL